MSILDEMKKIFNPYEDEDEYEEDFNDQDVSPFVDERDRGGRSERKGGAVERKGNITSFDERRNKVVNIAATTQLKVVLVKPERFEMASEIADHLKEKRTVVINLESTHKDIARRLIDFLSGVAYASEGRVKRVAANTYIITPYHVEMVGDLLDELENNGLYF